MKQIILLALLMRWSDPRWRWILIAWIAYEIVSVALRLGARGDAVIFALSAILFFHRAVRPLRYRSALMVGALFLSGFLLVGFARQFGGYAAGAGNLRETFSATNEFQALFATAVDIHVRRDLGMLPPVPWQIYVADAYLMIPSQLLPFEKWDPAEWYLEVVGMRGQGVGFMFGVMSQAAVGRGSLELVLRGVAIGLFFGLMHRWYVRHASSFWFTLLYAFMAIWSFYTFRATTFWFLYFVVYQFLPVVLMTRFLAMLLRRARRGVPAGAPA